MSEIQKRICKTPDYVRRAQKNYYEKIKLTEEYKNKILMYKEKLKNEEKDENKNYKTPLIFRQASKRYYLKIKEQKNFNI